MLLQFAAEAETKQEEQLKGLREQLSKVQESLRSMTDAEEVARNASVASQAQVAEMQETLRVARQSKATTESEELQGMHRRMTQASSVIQQLNDRITKQIMITKDCEFHKSVVEARARQLESDLLAVRSSVDEEKRATQVSRDLHARSVALLSSERLHAEKNKKESDKSLRNATEQVNQLKAQVKKLHARVRELESKARSPLPSSSSSEEEEEEEEEKVTRKAGPVPATLRCWLWILTLKLAEIDTSTNEKVVDKVDIAVQTEGTVHLKHKNAHEEASRKEFAEAGVQTDVETGKRKSIEENFWLWVVSKAEQVSIVTALPGYVLSVRCAVFDR